MQEENIGWVSRQPCPNQECLSSDAFSYNTVSMSGKCHSCDLKYPREMKVLTDWADGEYPTKANEWNEGPHMQLVHKNEEPVVKELLTPTYRSVRSLSEATLRYYKAQTYVNPSNKVVKQEYVYPSGGIKTRFMPKDFRAKNLKSDELFGMNLWNAGSCKTVTITEGELDAMSAYQMCNNDKYPAAFVSLPSSTPSHKLWANVDKWLKSFDKIVLSIEHDDAGNSIAQRIANLYPNKVYRMQHDTYKDANEFLEAGKKTEFFQAWFHAKKYTPENIYNSTDDFIKLYENHEDHMYIETGIQDFDALCLGLMQGHFTVFKAQTGIGKTEFMRYLEYNILKNYPDVPIAAWHMEETKLRTLLGLVSYEIGDNVTRPDIIEENGLDSLVREAITKLTGREKFYQFFLNDNDDPIEILSHIRYLSQACGVKYVFFEPIQDIAASLGADESKEQFLSDLAVRLSKLAAELGVGIITIGHTNDDGAIKYCRMIEQRASVVVELQRNKMAEDVNERNTTKLLVTKNRPVGPTGFAGQLNFNPDTFMLSESFGDI